MITEQTQAKDWRAWHDDYADPTSALSRRLHLVRGHIDAWLDDRLLDPELNDGPDDGRTNGLPGAEVTVVSACAGQGHDLFDVLRRRTARRPDRGRVRATLIEFDPSNAAIARATADRMHLGRVEVRCADAGDLASYAGAVPADLLVFAGIFGNISNDDIERSITALPTLCAPGATVIWTRTRKPPDVTTAVRGWFAAAGFEEVAFHAPDDVMFSVGRHHLRGSPQPLADGRIFRFLTPGTATG